MEISQHMLLNSGRILMGFTFLTLAFFDLKTRSTVFEIMHEKRVIFPWFCYVGAVSLKILTSVAIILNFHTPTAALLLAVYIFIANLVFYNFWKATDPKKRDLMMIHFLNHIAMCAGLISIAGIANQ